MILALALATAAVPAVSAGATSAETPTAQIIQIGTEVPLILLDDLSTKTSPKGTPFDLEVAEDVTKEGKILIPAGTRAVGEVTRSDPKGAFGKSGKLEGAIMYIVLGGKPVRMSGRLSAAGAGGGTETALTAIAAGLMAFAVTGKSASMPKGTRLRAFIDRNVSVEL